MRKLLALTLALALSIGLLVAAETGASAKKPKSPITFVKIGTQKVAYGASARIVPTVKSPSGYERTSVLMTIKKGKKTVARSVAAMNLKAGTYKVTTMVKYRPFTVKTNTVTTHQVSRPAGTPVGAACTIVTVDLVGSLTASCALDDGTGSTPLATTYQLLATPGTWDLGTGDGIVTLTDDATSLIGRTFAEVVAAPVDLLTPVTTTSQYRAYGTTKTVSASQTLKIKQGKKPKPKSKSDDDWLDSSYSEPYQYVAPPPSGGSAPIGWDCPASAPIKGNASSHIYHLPGGAYYNRTNPERCFATEGDAISAGYRRSQR